MSSKAGAELNSVEVSYTIENKTTQNLYCHYRPLILFNERIDNFGVEVSAPVLIEAGKSYSPSKPEVFTGIKVLGDGTKMPVVSELKLYGMCRSTEAEAKSMFQSSCMKESAAGCDSFVKK
jgi:hypothetical protein